MSKGEADEVARKWRKGKVTCVINSIAKKAGREGERARAAIRMAACAGEAKGAEPVTTLLDSTP